MTDKLTSLSNGATLSYDAADRLAQTTGGSTTRFLYDGDQIIGEYDASGNVLRRYVPGPGTDQPIVWYEGSGTSDRRFLITDRQGSVTAVTNASGGVLAINTYDEAGIPGPNNTGRFQYNAAPFIPEAGLYHMRARAYSPTLGRFMQPDPIGYGDGMNVYNYVHGDPVNGWDPSGMDGVDGTVEEVVVTAQPKFYGGGSTAFSSGNIGSFSPSSASAPPPPIEPVVVTGRKKSSPPPSIVSLVNGLVTSTVEEVVVIASRPTTTAHTFSIQFYWNGNRILSIPFFLPDISFTRPGSSPPAVGPPGRFIQGPRRGRQYGPDGKPVYDIDNPHQGYPDPHAHNWNNGVREEPGYPVSPLPGQPNTTGDDDGG